MQLWGDGAYKIIKKAHDQGFKVIAYDNWDFDIYSRDQKQYLNLKTLIFNEHPQAKVIIFGGAKHISETIEYVSHKDQIIIKPLGSYIHKFNNNNFSLDMTGRNSYKPDARIVNGKLTK